MQKLQSNFGSKTVGTSYVGEARKEILIMSSVK
jgi:hypothetical protein